MRTIFCTLHSWLQIQKYFHINVSDTKGIGVDCLLFTSRSCCPSARRGTCFSCASIGLCIRRCMRAWLVHASLHQSHVWHIIICSQIPCTQAKSVHSPLLDASKLSHTRIARSDSDQSTQHSHHTLSSTCTRLPSLCCANGTTDHILMAKQNVTMLAALLHKN